MKDKDIIAFLSLRPGFSNDCATEKWPAVYFTFVLSWARRGERVCGMERAFARSGGAGSPLPVMKWAGRSAKHLTKATQVPNFNLAVA